jgi:tumor protein p53-inducible protein 3
VLFGTMGGGSVEGGLFAQLLRKRIAITGSTLRSRSLGYKAELTHAFTSQALPRLAAGVYIPVVDREYPLAEVQAAHEYMETNANVGKIVLRIA